MSKVVNGVLIPAEMADAPRAELEQYAYEARATNRHFVSAHFELERQAMAVLTEDEFNRVFDRG